MVILSQIADSTSVCNTLNTGVSNVWFWVSVAEAVIILLLIFGKKSSKRIAQDKFKKEALKGDIDFDNIINSSFHASYLYDELKIVCHPDRFIDPILQDKADAIFQEITQNRRDFKTLQELKMRAIDELKIKP